VRGRLQPDSSRSPRTSTTPIPGLPSCGCAGLWCPDHMPGIVRHRRVRLPVVRQRDQCLRECPSPATDPGRVVPFSASRKTSLALAGSRFHAGNRSQAGSPAPGTRSRSPRSPCHRPPAVAQHEIGVRPHRRPVPAAGPQRLSPTAVAASQSTPSCGIPRSSAIAVRVSASSEATGPPR
jgi:hypothetical protein